MIELIQIPIKMHTFHAICMATLINSIMQHCNETRNYISTITIRNAGEQYMFVLIELCSLKYHLKCIDTYSSKYCDVVN